jgi:hypothetical protein
MRSLGEVGDLVVYLAINIIAKRAALKMAHSGSPPTWQRDDSSRI